MATLTRLGLKNNQQHKGYPLSFSVATLCLELCQTTWEAGKNIESQYKKNTNIQLQSTGRNSEKQDLPLSSLPNHGCWQALK